MRYKRIFLIVLDSLGIGAMPDAAEYGDAGTNTFVHIWERMQGLNIPNLQKLGMGNLCRVTEDEETLGYRMRLKEASTGKDTMTGHWEMMGILTTKPFRTFTDTGFPDELIKELEEKCGRKIIGNKAASGTEILEELAEREIQNGELIVYTSADSVLQICGNEETMGVETLYRYCEIARELTMKEEWRVGRVIARPYTGLKKGEFRRTPNRRDYALAPEKKTVLDFLKESGIPVVGIGKIEDIFAGQGITESEHSKSSVHGMEQTIQKAKELKEGLVFTNLVDFDALWGHRRDPIGYGKEIEAFDVKLGELLSVLGEDDLVMLTADHGNDPTHTGTDHTRETVPLLMYAKSMSGQAELKDADTFGVIGATVAKNFAVDLPDSLIGESILEKLV